MTDSPGAILIKLESFGKNQDRMEAHLIQMDENHAARLSAIEMTIGKLAVQDEKLSTLKTEDRAQWKKIDGHSITIDKLKLHQVKCPIDKVAKLEVKVTALDLCQAKCPAVNAKYHLAGMWALLVIILGAVARLFTVSINQAERLIDIVKSGIIK